MCCLPLFLRLCDDTLKNLRFYAVLPTTKSRLKPSFGVFRCKLLLEICVKIFFTVPGLYRPMKTTRSYVHCLDSRPACDGRTDGRTDGHTADSCAMPRVKKRVLKNDVRL